MAGGAAPKSRHESRNSVIMKLSYIILAVNIKWRGGEKSVAWRQSTSPRHRRSRAGGQPLFGAYFAGATTPVGVNSACWPPKSSCIRMSADARHETAIIDALPRRPAR